MDTDIDMSMDMDVDVDIDIDLYIDTNMRNPIAQLRQVPPTPS